MKDYFHRLKKGTGILLLQQSVAVLAFSFSLIFFKEQGYELWKLLLIYVISTGTAVVIALLLNKFNIKYYLMLGFFFYALMALVLYIYIKDYSFFFYAVFMGMTYVLFWVPLNYVFFRNSKSTTNAVDSSVYANLPGLIVVFIPPIGAYIIDSFGYNWLFAVSAAVFLLSILLLKISLLKKVPEEKLNSSLNESITLYRKLKTITFFEGALQFFSGVIVSIYALQFLSKEAEVGWYFSYLYLIGFLVSFALAYYSDKNQKRITSLYVLFFLLAVSIVALLFAKTVLFWVVAVGAFSIMMAVSCPLRLAISMDYKEVNMSFWRARELFLNLGRFTALFISVFFFYYQIYWPVFILFAVIAVAYPFLVQYKLNELEKFY